MVPPLALGKARTEDRGQARRATGELRAVSLLRILHHDNPAFLLALFGTVQFLFALAVWITGSTPGGRGRPARDVSPEEARAHLALMALVMLCGAALACVRALWLRHLFRHGEPVPATVTQVSTAKGYSRVRFEYRHGGVARTLRRTIRRSARARELAPGDVFTLLVDPGRPRRVVMAELYEP